MTTAADTEGPQFFGLLVELGNEAELRRACHGLRDAGYTLWDAHTPYPVHGLERDMGLGSSPVGWFVFVLGMGGAAAGMLLQWWTSAVASPLVVSGKPLFSWPAFIPIAFELGVLGGALGAVLGFLLLARLPAPYHPLFHSARFERTSDDGFFVSVEARDPRFEPDGTRRLLEELGARHVEELTG